MNRGAIAVGTAGSGLPDVLPACVDTRAAFCVFVSGSLVEGWGHRDSDVDVYVIRDAEPDRVDFRSTLGLVDHDMATSVHFVDGRRWDVCYWTPQLLRDAMAQIEAYQGDRHELAKRLQPGDVAFCYRLTVGVALDGHDHLLAWQRRLAAARVSEAVAYAAAEEADAAIEDALGLGASGDVHSSVLATRRAVDHAVDAFAAYHGMLAPGEKWRYRKYAQVLRSVSDPPVSLADLWCLQTMRDFRPDEPSSWVRTALSSCHAMLSRIDFDQQPEHWRSPL